MTIPLHTRQFNIADARAGAPFCCANGDAVEILKWDRKHTQCIIGLARQDAAVRKWRADGSYEDANSSAFQLVMTPLGFVDGKPVFVGDELVTPTGMKWVASPVCRDTLGRSLADCRWPAPAPVYPETRLHYTELISIAMKTNSSPMAVTGSQVLTIANFALRHAIDAGQVITLPLPGVMVSIDLSPIEQEGAIRAKMIELGWTPPDQSAPTKKAYDQCNSDLGKAERLLESLGYRSAGDGEWKEPDLSSINLQGIGTVRGDTKAVAHLTKLLCAKADRVRDLGLAEQLLESLGWRSAGNGQWLAPDAGDAHLRAARDMAIAVAVRASCEYTIGGPDRVLKGNFILNCFKNIDLDAIIARVKP